jgi:hypothetical protein
LRSRGSSGFPTRWRRRRARFLASPFNPAAFGPTIAAFLLTLLRQGGRGALTAGFMISFLALAVLVVLRIEGAVRLGRQRAQRERCAVYDATYNALDIAQGENQR